MARTLTNWSNQMQNCFACDVEIDDYEELHFQKRFRNSTAYFCSLCAVKAGLMGEPGVSIHNEFAEEYLE